MDQTRTTTPPDGTAVRTALWRALHVITDDKPHIIEDKIGYALIQPEEGWQQRSDMKYTRRLRASVVARARFVDDIVKEQMGQGVTQYVLLGAGLDSFAQRNADVSAQVDIFEIDQPEMLAWKEEKLMEKGYLIPDNLHFVPVDFETSSWWAELLNNGFAPHQQTIVSCTGVTLYLTKETIIDTLKKMASLATGSTLVMAFYLPLELLDEEDQPMQEIAIKGAAASGTPFVSFFPVEEIVTLAKAIGLKAIQTISTKDMTDKYFKGRTDHLAPASGAFFLLAKT